MSKSFSPLHLALLWLLQRLGWVFRKVFNFGQNPNRLTVDILLSLSWLSFRCLGWSHSIGLWQQWHQTHPPLFVGEESSNSSQIIHTVDALVRETATGKLFLPMVCKERALVGYHLLRVFYGLPAVLIIGINRYPFQIHAWVECDNLIVTDDRAHCEMFTPVVRYP